MSIQKPSDHNMVNKRGHFKEMTNATKHGKIGEILQDFYKVFGNSTKLTILTFIIIYKKEVGDYPNKSTIHNALKKIGITMAYKNLLWYLDELKKLGVVTFKKVKEKNNSTLVAVNKSKIQVYTKNMNEALKIISTYFK